jgi:ribonuclease Z
MISVYPLQGTGGLSTSILVNWEGTRFLLDAGPGTITEIWRRGLRLRGLSAIALSHTHLDHLWGLPPLLWFLHQRNWSHELHLIYPSESEPIIKQMVALSGNPPFVTFTPCSSQAHSISLKSLTIQAFDVNHPGPSYGYSISESPKPRLDTEKLRKEGIPQTHWRTIAEGKQIRHNSRLIDAENYQLAPRCRKIVYTGDAGPASQLIERARGADLLIIEASWLNPQWELEIDAPHLTLREAFEIGLKSEVRNLLLIHLTYRVALKEYQEAIVALKKEFQTSFQVYLPTDEQIQIR